MAQFIYIASQDPNGGILWCTLTQEGKLEVHGRYPLDRPAYLCAEGNRLYAVLREPFQMQSGVAEFSILPNGELKREGGIQPVHGTISAHILSHRGQVYTANYLSGSTTRLPDRLLAHNGSSVDKVRQDCSHPHCVTAAPGGDYLCINDLGTDCIYICTPELEEVSRVRVPAGSGPRHLVFSPNGAYAYCSNEMGSSVSVFTWVPGKLKLLDTVSALPEGYQGQSSGSAIRMAKDGTRLWISLRQMDSVCEMAVEGARLSPKRWIPCGGESPREIQVVGKYLLCANESSHNIRVISLEDGTPVSDFKVMRPWCILTVEL